jgi:hypothetical protein
MKGAMKKNSKSIPNGAVNFFVDVIFHLSIGKVAVNAPGLWKFLKECRTDVGKGCNGVC